MTAQVAIALALTFGPAPANPYGNAKPHECGCSFGGICRCGADGLGCTCDGILERKPKAPRILVVCSTQSCLPCRRVEQTLDAYAWPVRIIKLKDSPYFKEMQVTQFPTLILAEPDGTIIETRIGEQSRDQLARWLK